jgi:hypothetical protein
MNNRKRFPFIVVKKGPGFDSRVNVLLKPTFGQKPSLRNSQGGFLAPYFSRKRNHFLAGLHTPFAHEDSLAVEHVRQGGERKNSRGEESHAPGPPAIQVASLRAESVPAPGQAGPVSRLRESNFHWEVIPVFQEGETVRVNPAIDSSNERLHTFQDFPRDDFGLNKNLVDIGKQSRHEHIPYFNLVKMAELRKFPLLDPIFELA